MVPAEIAFLVLLSAGSLFYFSQSFRRLPTAGENPEQRKFDVGDIVLAILLGLFYGSMVCAAGAHVVITEAVIWQSLAIYAASIILIIGFLVSRGRNPIKLFGLKWNGWKKALPSAFLGLIALYPLILLTQYLVKYLLGSAAKEQDILQFLATAPSWHERAAVIFMAILVAPVAEETIFRGYLYGVGRQYLGRWPALILVSLIFALMHANLQALPGLFIFAAFLTLIYEKIGSLWATMSLHATFNLVTVIFTICWPQTMP